MPSRTPSSSNSPGWLATGALALGSLAVCLAVAELAVRQLVGFTSSGVQEHRIPDARLGWALEPNARFTYVHDGEAIPVAYNAHGLHDVERELAKRAGVHRIALLGDSFMESYSLRLEDALPRRLEALLSRPERPVEVINFGVGGYGTFQQYRMFQDRARAWQPDLVLLGFFLGNDLHENSVEIETYRKPGTRAARRRPFLLPGPGWQTSEVDVEESWRRYHQARKWRGAWWWRAGDVSRLWRLSVAQWLASAHEAALAAEDADADGGAGEQSPEDRRARDEMQRAVFSCEIPPEYERAWQITERILTRLAGDVARANARFLVFSVPARADTMPADDPRVANRCLHDLPGWRRLAAILERLGVPLVDLRPDLRASDVDPLFFPDDAHWTPGSHAVAARRLAAELEERWAGEWEEDWAERGADQVAEAEAAAPR